MEIAFIILSVLLILYGILGFYDGVYLHLYRYKLYNHVESKTEHLTHTIRAVLFPFILYSLFIRTDCNWFFLFGLLAVVADVITLGVDAFLEHESRKFMGGLPRWEYVIHLFVNGFHFASIAVFLAIKVKLSNIGIELLHDFSGIGSFHAFNFIVQNLLPGTILIGLLHLLVYLPKFSFWFNKLKFSCC